MAAALALSWQKMIASEFWEIRSLRGASLPSFAIKPTVAGDGSYVQLVADARRGLARGAALEVWLPFGDTPVRES